MTHGAAPVHAPGVGDHWRLLLWCKGLGCLRTSSNTVESAGLKCFMRCDEGVDAAVFLWATDTYHQERLCGAEPQPWPSLMTFSRALLTARASAGTISSVGVFMWQSLLYFPSLYLFYYNADISVAMVTNCSVTFFFCAQSWSGFSALPRSQRVALVSLICGKTRKSARKLLSDAAWQQRTGNGPPGGPAGTLEDCGQGRPGCIFSSWGQMRCA